MAEPSPSSSPRRTRTRTNLGADFEPAKITHEGLVEIIELLREHLGSPDNLSSKSIRWDRFPDLLKLWDILWAAQARVAQDAKDYLDGAHTGLGSDTSAQDEVLHALKEIVAGKQRERDSHFALGLYWRRRAVWQHFRENLHNPASAKDMLHLYLVKPVGGVKTPGEVCRPYCQTKEEQQILLALASKHKNYISKLGSWLKGHPEAAALLRDTKGKGKARAVEEDEDLLDKQKAHFERCLEEIEPRARLRDLLLATRDWLDCFQARLETAQAARHMRESLIKRQGAILPPVQAADPIPPSPKDAVIGVAHKTGIDRGTSPIDATEAGLATNTLHQDQYGDEIFATTAEPVASTSKGRDAMMFGTMLPEDDSPPSPQSLPSPPPHAQGRPKRFDPPTTDESQTSTSTTSFKAEFVTIPSGPLPGVQSSSHATTATRPESGPLKEPQPTVRPPTQSQQQVANEGVLREQTAQPVSPPRKKRKRVSRLPLVSDEIMRRLEEAGLEAARLRQEEREREQIPAYDPWAELVGYVSPGDQSPRDLASPPSADSSADAVAIQQQVQLLVVEAMQAEPIPDHAVPPPHVGADFAMQQDLAQFHPYAQEDTTIPSAFIRRQAIGLTFDAIDTDSEATSQERRDDDAEIAMFLSVDAE